jgi:prophage DNA circulation protein
VPTADTPQEVSEAVYQALVALRAALVRDITARSVDAPRLSSATLPATLPALVAAYRLLGDATRADELIERNSQVIRNPGFVPGGTALEIVVD